MNKTAIKNFSINARKKLLDSIRVQAGLLGISEQGIAQPLKQSTKDLQFFDIGTRKYAEVAGPKIRQRNALAAAIRAKAEEVGYAKAYDCVIEEVAYTWFNRLIAIRFMEVNDYLPDHTRVLSSENSAKLEPDLVTHPFDSSLTFTAEERELVTRLKDEDKLDALFQMLFIKECDALRESLPGLFEHTTEYAELLLSISFRDTDGVVYRLTHDIAESDFNVAQEGQVEIIGWLYQYYNTVPKSDAFAKGTITKDEIPAVTQLFTPDWIVRYMVENSLGRLWLDGHPGDTGTLLPTEQEQQTYIAGQRDKEDTKWHYYLPEAEQPPEVQHQLETIYAEHGRLTPESIRLIDPCMGSGHVLVYAFDVFMQLYLAQGYTKRDAARSILQNNLFGADIDKRAYQLAYFAVMMKARQYNRHILSEGIEPNLIVVSKPKFLSAEALKQLGELEPLGKRLLETFRDAEELGSILNVDLTEQELDALDAKLDELSEKALYADFVTKGDYNACVFVLEPMLKQARILGQKYHVVVTNPPYMAPTAKQKPFVEKNYPASKADLFAVFIEKCGQMLVPNGYQAMITMHSWMFLSSYEKLRLKLQQSTIVNMAHLGARAFEEIGGEVVQTTAFVIGRKHIAEYRGVYCRLIEPTSQVGKEKMFLAGEKRYAIDQSNFSKIPGAPVAYNFSDKVFHAFEAFKSLPKYGTTRLGMTTASNETFVRLWFEVAIKRCCLDADNAEQVHNAHVKWVPYNKGGGFRRWFGNMDCVVNWENDGYEIKHFGENTGHIRSTVPNTECYFLRCGTWSKISSGKIAVRYRPAGSIFDVAGACIYPQSGINLYSLIAFLNSNVAMKLLSVLSPTMNFEGGHISSLPICIPDKSTDYITKVEKCISISRDDWDSYETSWDFKRHPLL